ncbi:MAG TPA: alpha/beta hydrolase [Roseiarcus sp.]|nr:alpha/beta hydrolase [Roseiarcus sp.]
MPALETQGISLHYELFGDRAKPPVMLIAGLGGAGASFGAQIQRFAKDHFVVLPDHRGTGRSTRAKDGYTMAQHAADMASLIEYLGVGPTHLVGTSTGGAIAQLMALDHAADVRSVVISSAYARPDAYTRREFSIRRKMVEHFDARTIYDLYSLFLFSPDFAHRNPESVQDWIDRTAARPLDKEIALKRIDMVMAHDVLARLGDIRQPTLILCGDHDVCAPPHLSEEISKAMPKAKFEIFKGGGHMIHDEMEDLYFETVSRFIDSH